MPPKSNQVKFDFDRLDEAGLKPLIKKFGKWQCNITKIEATNRGKRESGFLIKNFTLHFEDGQKMLVRVKGDGTVFQVKLNNKVVPIRHTDNMDKAIVELVDYVQDNAKAFEKARIQREKRKLLPQQKRVRVPRAERIQALEEDLLKLNQTNGDLEKQTTELGGSLRDVRQAVESVRKELDREKHRTTELEGEIAQLEKIQEAA